MDDKKLITEADLESNSELVEAGLKVGDLFPQKKKAGPKKVEVDEDMLMNILKEVEGMRAKVEKVDRLEKENEMLISVADKGRLVTWQAKNNPQGLVRTARAWVFREKLVKATLTVKNSVFTDVNGRVWTDQVLKVVFADGTETEISYDEFSKEKSYREGDIINRSTTDSDNQTFYTLKFKDGEEFTVNYLFIN